MQLGQGRTEAGILHSYLNRYRATLLLAQLEEPRPEVAHHKSRNVENKDREKQKVEIFEDTLLTATHNTPHDKNNHRNGKQGGNLSRHLASTHP